MCAHLRQEACGASGPLPMDFDAKFFFSFMKLTDVGTSSGLSFSNLCSKGCSLDQTGFLQLQCALLHHWVDKFKTLSEDGTVSLLATLPRELHGPELIRTDGLCYNLGLLYTVSGPCGYNAICDMLSTFEFSCCPIVVSMSLPGHAAKTRRAILWSCLGWRILLAFAPVSS